MGSSPSQKRGDRAEKKEGPQGGERQHEHHHWPSLYSEDGWETFSVPGVFSWDLPIISHPSASAQDVSELHRPWLSFWIRVQLSAA